jgi:hypothetical protein
MFAGERLNALAFAAEAFAETLNTEIVGALARFL